MSTTEPPESKGTTISKKRWQGLTMLGTALLVTLLEWTVDNWPRIAALLEP